MQDHFYLCRIIFFNSGHNSWIPKSDVIEVFNNGKKQMHLRDGEQNIEERDENSDSSDPENPRPSTSTGIRH